MKRIGVFLSCCLLVLLMSLQAKSAEPPLTLLPSQVQNPAAQGSSGSPSISNLHDIYGPLVISEPVSYLLLASLVTALVFLLLLIYWLFKRRKQPVPLPIPPWERAMRDLSALKPYLNSKESLIYLEKASLVLRSYIESRFAIESTKKTTREFLTGLEFSTENTLLHTFKEELQNCLQIADMAKFAHHLAEQAELQKIERSIQTFIEKTTPQSHEKGIKP